MSHGEQDDRNIEIFTDGACSGNPGPGGWAAIIREQGNTRELWGYESRTTNNRMELRAVIEALNAISSPSNIAIYTDSRYVREGITSWISRWRRNAWKTASGSPVKNRDLWEQLYELTTRHRIEWHWVPGHQHHPENERCDALARRAITTQRSSGA